MLEKKPNEQNQGTDNPEETQTISEKGSETTPESSDSRSADNEDGEQAKEKQTDPKEGSDSTSTVQESLPLNPAEQYADLSTEINQSLSGLLEKLNSGNQTLDEIKEDIEKFKENNLLEAHPVIHHLIQFYDTFVLVESQLNDINKAFEALGNQSGAIGDIPQNDAIPDPDIGTIKGTLKSVQDKIDERLREENGKRRKKKELVKELEDLRTLLQSSPSPSQAEAEAEGGSVAPPEDPKDGVSLCQANAKMKDRLSQFRHNLENARYEFVEVLARIDDVVPYTTVPNKTNPPKFDPKMHRSVDTEVTECSDKDRKVAESHKAGFHRGVDEKQTVFRHEEVTVYRYEKPAGEHTKAGDEVSTEEKTSGDPTGVNNTPVEKEGEKENG